MAELIGMCDRLLVMKDGAVQKEFLRGQMNEADIIRCMIQNTNRICHLDVCFDMIFSITYKVNNLFRHPDND